MTITFEYVSTNGIRLHAAHAGPEDGEPVLLLHGFPEAWFGWEAQIGPLAEAGFRVLAPDQRGYNLSDKPKGVSSYRMDALVHDVLGLADAFGYERFHLGGGLGGKADSLHHFKARFDPEGLVVAAVGKAIHDEDAYRELSGGESSYNGFFPAYRRP